MLWDPKPGQEAEARISARMNDYWFFEAYIAFPEKMSGHTWALIHALSYAGRRDNYE